MLLILPDLIIERVGMKDDEEKRNIVAYIYILSGRKALQKTEFSIIVR